MRKIGRCIALFLYLVLGFCVFADDSEHERLSVERKIPAQLDLGLGLSFTGQAIKDGSQSQFELPLSIGLTLDNTFNFSVDAPFITRITNGGNDADRPGTHPEVAMGDPSLGFSARLFTGIERGTLGIQIGVPVSSAAVDRSYGQLYSGSGLYNFGLWFNYSYITDPLFLGLTLSANTSPIGYEEANHWVYYPLNMSLRLSVTQLLNSEFSLATSISNSLSLGKANERGIDPAEVNYGAGVSAELQYFTKTNGFSFSINANFDQGFVSTSTSFNYHWYIDFE